MKRQSDDSADAWFLAVVARTIYKSPLRTSCHIDSLAPAAASGISDTGGAAQAANQHLPHALVYAKSFLIRPWMKKCRWKFFVKGRRQFYLKRLSEGNFYVFFQLCRQNNAQFIGFFQFGTPTRFIGGKGDGAGNRRHRRRASGGCFRHCRDRFNLFRIF